jgi:hypothetical protein
MRSPASASTNSCKVMKELLYISHAISEISNAVSEVIESRLHAIETVFYRHEPFVRSGGIVILLRRRQAANEMVLLGMLTGAAHEFRYAFCITCITDEEIIF